MEMKRLSIKGTEMATKAGKDSAMLFEGYIARFGNVDSHGDVIRKGAFARTLAESKNGDRPWPALLSQHGSFGMTASDATPVGVWTDLNEDDLGLKGQGELADTPRGHELYTLMKMSPRPAISGLSIGYVSRVVEYAKNMGDPDRTLLDVDLLEGSIVTFPSNSQSVIGDVKSIEALTDIRAAERFLMSIGLTKNHAVAFIAKIKSCASGDPSGGTGNAGDPDADLAALKLALETNLKNFKG